MSPRNFSAVSMNLSCSTAALITPLRLRPSYASDRCLIFKDWNGRKDSTWAFWLLISAGTSTGERLCRGPGLHRPGREAARAWGGGGRGLAVLFPAESASRPLLFVAAILIRWRRRWRRRRGAFVLRPFLAALLAGLDGRADDDEPVEQVEPEGRALRDGHRRQEDSGQLQEPTLQAPRHAARVVRDVRALPTALRPRRGRRAGVRGCRRADACVGVGAPGAVVRAAARRIRRGRRRRLRYFGAVPADGQAESVHLLLEILNPLYGGVELRLLVGRLAGRRRSGARVGISV